MSPQAYPYSWGPLRTFLLTWLFLAVTASRFGFFAGPVPVAQLMLGVMTALLGFAAWRVPAIHDALWNCDIRILIGFHLTRFVGLYFLELYNEGRLPYDFGVKGGIGDIVVATLALVVLIIPRAVGFRSAAIQIWNLIGLVDILYVLMTAIRMNIVKPHSMDELQHMPMSLLPTFLVPIVIVTHVVIGLRLRAESRATASFSQ